MNNPLKFVTVIGINFEKDFSGLTVSGAFDEANNWIKTSPERYVAVNTDSHPDYGHVITVL